MDLEKIYNLLVLLLARIGKSVKPAASAEAGQIPVADGEGGYAWGAATTGVVSAIDTNSDGNVEILYVEGS